ncbi:MAG: response regulator [Deltaproteobacteria bacterium]|nr:response regulator [Deltaproteobacteria bacterium]MBW2192498.1 response regulator [Deltaproteobacteria bacterium]
MDNVLIAEDDKILLKILVTIMGKYADKFTVIPVRDGQEAIDVLKKEPVSILVTDIQMPRVDGLNLLAYVREHHPNVPCFVMSAHGSPQIKAKLPQDLLQFFSKPFDIDELGKAIIETLERDTTRDDFQRVSLVSFLNMIEMEQASCVFDIKPGDQNKGMLYFKDGVLFDAEYIDLKGEAAAIELISMKKATFGFKFFSPEGLTRQITKDLNQLIHEALGERKED